MAPHLPQSTLDSWRASLGATAHHSSGTKNPIAAWPSGGDFWGWFSQYLPQNGVSKTHASVFAFYIAMSCAGPLLIKLSESTNRSLDYNPAAAVLCIEVVKLTVAYVADIRNIPFGFFAATSVGTSVPVEKQGGGSKADVAWNQWALYAVPSLLYAIVNNLQFFAISGLGAHYFALFSTGKIFCAAIAARILLGKRLNEIQWTALLLLVCSLCVAREGRTPRPVTVTSSSGNVVGTASTETSNPFVNPDVAQPSPLSSSSGDMQQVKPGETVASMDDVHHHSSTLEDRGLRFAFGFACVCVTCVLSGLTGVVNEFLLKRIDGRHSLWRKSMWTYQWGCVFNAVACFVFLNSERGLFDGFSLPVMLYIVLKAGEGLGAGFLLSFFDTIVKGFASSLQVLVVSLLSWMLFDETVLDGNFFLALVIFFAASFLYSGRHNEDIMRGHSNQHSAGVEMKNGSNAGANLRGRTSSSSTNFGAGGRASGSTSSSSSLRGAVTGQTGKDAGDEDGRRATGRATSFSAVGVNSEIQNRNSEIVGVNSDGTSIGSSSSYPENRSSAGTEMQNLRRSTGTSSGRESSGGVHEEKPDLRFDNISSTVAEDSTVVLVNMQEDLPASGADIIPSLPPSRSAELVRSTTSRAADIMKKKKRRDLDTSKGDAELFAEFFAEDAAGEEDPNSVIHLPNFGASLGPDEENYVDNDVDVVDRV
ncbi:unnamed protein product [Amoebophrya sp. A25]|nr:unnamed protein product [Amoebophrya sp. A25]|eukprot:GSA25T00015564001.1